MSSMDAAPFLIERVSPPSWITAGNYDHGRSFEDAFGEQTEWGFSIPWLYRALASPMSNEPMLRAPQRAEDHTVALAYWSSFLHLLLYGFGWARPDRGLRWWYDAGKPVDDKRLQLLSQIWDDDGQLDWMAAWLWTHGWSASTQYLCEISTYVDHQAPVPVDDRWIEDRSAEAAASEIHNPLTGGSDPLHLSGHATAPLEIHSGKPLLVRTNRAGRRATLVLNSMVGWYRALIEEGAKLPAHSGRSWHVDVVVRPLGWLGNYRQSRVTGLWFCGRHSLHVRGV